MLVCSICSFLTFCTPDAIVLCAWHAVWPTVWLTIYQQTSFLNFFACSRLQSSTQAFTGLLTAHQPNFVVDHHAQSLFSTAWALNSTKQYVNKLRSAATWHAYHLPFAAAESVNHGR